MLSRAFPVTRRWSSSIPGNISATDRMKSLRQIINSGKIVRAMEVHSGLSALVTQHAKAIRDGEEMTYNAMWSSSLTSSTIKAKPDIETVDTSERLAIVQDALEVCSKPMIYDGDTGGQAEVFHFTVKKLERLGVSAVIIEDKAGLKQNSLFGTDRKQQLEDVDEFCRKIKTGRAARLDPDFMVIARLEALIAGLGEKEAIDRAQAYIDAGVDGIMIHSKQKDPAEVLSFLKTYRGLSKTVPVVAVPTTYNVLTEQQLLDNGVSICIYANHLLRAAYPAMMQVAEAILKHGRSQEVDAQIMKVKEILNLIQQPNKL